MNKQTKKLIRLSVEVEISYDKGLRGYALALAKNGCRFHLTRHPMSGSGSIEVKTTGNVEEIKTP